MLECVVNVSEGRGPDVVEALAAACGGVLLDVHTDPDHHRSVFTLAGAALVVQESALALARSAVERIDLRTHTGVHPRLGAVDVVPFVDLAPELPPAPRLDIPSPEVGSECPMAGRVAREWGRRAAEELGVPVFLYGDSDPAGRSLPETRRAAFRDREPDFGPARPHPSAGAMAVGARPVLVAINCELIAGGDGIDADLAVARAVARAVRERDGGLPGVRALGLALAGKGRAQVSMNLVDLTGTGVEEACSAVRRASRERGREVAAVELVGLLPAAELGRCSREFLAWSGLTADQTIEKRLISGCWRAPPPPDRS